MKKIEITGYKNIKRIDPKNPLLKANQLNIQEEYYTPEIQSTLANKLFMDESFENKTELLREIQKKINCYKQQDIKKNLLNTDLFISLNKTLEKLVISKLRCHYCRSPMVLFYKTIREPLQWTLDRIDNDVGHNCDNVVICCLACNLKRRRTNADAFLFTKQLKIIKGN
jgi:hypothetical protein